MQHPEITESEWRKLESQKSYCVNSSIDGFEDFNSVTAFDERDNPICSFVQFRRTSFVYSIGYPLWSVKLRMFKSDES